MENEELVIIDESYLENYWMDLVGTKNIGTIDHSRYIFIEGFKGLASDSKEEVLLYLKASGWKITIKKNLIKNLITAPAVAGVLQYFNLAKDIPGILFPMIISSLFDIDKVELTKKEETIYLKLPIDKTKVKFKTADEWYDSLPKTIKKQLHPLDFKDFMEKLMLVGLAKIDSEENYTIFTEDNKVFKVSLFTGK